MSPPLRPPEVPERAWRRIALAKQRLAVQGPTSIGAEAARLAAIAVAAELRLQGLPEDATLAAVEAMPFATDTTPRNKVKKQMRRAVTFAYSPKDNQPILSGCCRDPRPRTGSKTGGALRATFKPYCDQECERTCPMLRAVRSPDRALTGTPYEPLDASDVWTRGGSLGLAGHQVWRTLALLALASGTEEIQASGRFVCLKLGGALSSRHARRLLAAMHAHGIITRLNERSALRRVHALDTEAVAELEERLGVAGTRNANIREARLESDAYQDWLAGLFDRHQDAAAALAAWSLPKR